MQNKIIVRHSSIVIEDYNIGDCSSLEDFFTVFDPVTHSNLVKGIYYDEENKRLYLPRGIDVFYLERLFRTNAVLDKKFDQYDQLDPIYIKTLPRDDVQKEALRFVLGKKEYEYTAAHSQIGLNLNPGKGKTYVSIGAIAYEMIRPIVIANSNSLLDQWNACVAEYTDIKQSEIYKLVGGGSIARLFNGMRDISNYKFILASHDTIKSFGDRYGWDRITELFKMLKVGVKIYDEAHRNFDNICMIDFFTNTKKTIYLTATPGRSNENENNIYQMSFKNMPKIDLFNEDEDPRTSYTAMLYSSKPSPMDISECRNQFGLDRNKYIAYIVKQKRFYDMLTIILEIILTENDKALIYIGTNASINIVYEWIFDNYPEFRHSIGIYNSTIPQDKKDFQLEQRIILSNTKSCGEGMDIAGLSLTVVLAEPFKSEILARQSLGRTRGEGTRYLEVVDKAFYQILKFYNYKKPIFAKYATSCTEINISDTELAAKANNIRARRALVDPIFKSNFVQYTMVNGQMLENVIVKTRI